jgi:hypothetical protein
MRAATADTGAENADAVETTPGPAFQREAALGIRMMAAPVPNGNTHSASATRPLAPRSIVQVSENALASRRLVPLVG